MSADKRIWPGGLTTEEVMAEVMKGYYREEARMKAEEAKRKAREQVRTEKVTELRGPFPCSAERLSHHELLRRQAIIDEHWQAMLDEKARIRAAAERRSFHKGPDDPDWE
jgi:hypothetical protein